ncbi:MAG: hypothetical protein ACK4ZJ_17350, partial [Allorhizobium sp.]
QRPLHRLCLRTARLRCLSHRRGHGGVGGAQAGDEITELLNGPIPRCQRLLELRADRRRLLQRYISLLRRAAARRRGGVRACGTPACDGRTRRSWRSSAA